MMFNIICKVGNWALSTEWIVSTYSSILWKQAIPIFQRLMWAHNAFTWHLKATLNKSSLRRTVNVPWRVTADGSGGTKRQPAQIHANTSVTRSWRRLLLVTWLLCKACGWLGGPSGCATPVSEPDDELGPGTLDTSWPLRSHICTERSEWHS